MVRLEEVLSASKRNFLMIAHRARSDDKVQLNDLCGASGRWDGVARAITSALFLSHDMRRDTSIHILLLGPDDPPKLLSVNGEKVKYLNPDERASSALMRKCLGYHLPKERGIVTSPSPGINISRVDLSDILGSFKGAMIELDEKGIIFPGMDFKGKFDDGVMFVISDDQDLSTDEAIQISQVSQMKISLGSLVLHSHMVITIVHFLLDRSFE